MRRTITSLIVAVAAGVALTGCVIVPPGLDPYGFGVDGSYGPYGDDFDPAAEEQWQEKGRAWQLDFAEEVAEELRAAGSQLPPAEGESLESFRHLVMGVGYEWCDRLYVDDSRKGDAGEHSEQAQRYGWTADEYRVVAEAAELSLCGY